MSLAELLTTARVRSVSTSGGSATIRFGRTDVRYLHEGAPAEVWSIWEMEDGSLVEEHVGSPRLAHTVGRHVARAQQGWRARAVNGWIEVRAPRTKP